MDDSTSSDWGSDCQEAVPVDRPMIVIERKSNQLQLNEELLIKRYQEDFVVKATMFVQNTQIQTNFCKFKNSKWVTENDIITSINKKISLEEFMQARDDDVAFLEETLKFVIQYNGKLEIQVIFDILRRFKFSELQEQDQCMMVQIMKHTVRFVTSDNIQLYRHFFNEYFIKGSQGDMQKYSRAVFAISMIDNIDLLQNNDVKSNIKAMRDILLSIDDIQQYFCKYEYLDSVVYYYQNARSDQLAVQIIIEITQAIVAIQNYYSPISFAQLVDDYLLKYVHRYFKLKKTEQESQLASSSLECDKDCFITRDGERNLIVEVLGRQLSCSILLLSFATFQLDRRYLVNYLQSCALAGAFVQDYFSSNETEKLLTSSPVQQIVIPQNIEILGDIVAAGSYNITGLNMLIQYIPGYNLIKANIIKQNLLQNLKALKPQLKQHLVTQYYYLLKELGDYDSILGFLLHLFKIEPAEELCKLIGQAFDSIFQFQLAQAFYCMALSRYEPIFQPENLRLDSFDMQLATQYPKAHAELATVKQYQASVKSKLEILDMDVFNIYFQRILSYENQGNVQKAIELAQQLIDLQIDEYQRSKLLPKLCNIYIKFFYVLDNSSTRYLHTFEQLLINQFKNKQSRRSVASMQIYLDYLLKRQQFITVLLLSQLLRRNPAFLERVRTMAQMYEVYALFCMASYHITCNAFSVWPKTIDFTEPVREDVSFGQRILVFLAEATKTTTVLQPYDQVFGINAKKSTVKMLIPDREALIGLLYYSVQSFLRKSSFQIQQQKTTDIRIMFSQLMLDLQIHEGVLHKSVRQFSLEYDANKGFYFQEQNNFTVEPQVVKHLILQIAKQPVVSLFSNFQILFLYLEYWLINDVNNPAIDQVFKHCSDTIAEAFLLDGNVLFAVFGSKQFYLVQISIILKTYLRLLLISSRPLSVQDFQILDAFIKLEYQMKNCQTHDYWPSRTRQELLSKNRQRIYTHSLSPELFRLLGTDEQVVRYFVLLQGVEQIYASITFQQESYQYFTKQFVKKQKNLELQSQHIQFTIYEENIEKLVVVTNQYYKYHIKTYFEQLANLRKTFKRGKMQCSMSNLLILLKLDSYVFAIADGNVVDIMQLTCQDCSQPTCSQSYYSDVSINPLFANRKLISIQKIVPLLRQFNENAFYELNPLSMMGTDYEIPLNQTESQLIIEYLRTKLNFERPFTHVLPSFYINFIPYERVFARVRRVFTLSHYSNNAFNRQCFNQKIARLVSYASFQNKQTGCTFSEKRVFRVQGAKFNIYGNKMKFPQDITSFIGRYYVTYAPVIVICQAETNASSVVERRKQQQSQFLTVCGKCQTLRCSSALFPLGCQLLKSDAMELQFSPGKFRPTFEVLHFTLSMMQRSHSVSEEEQCDAVNEMFDISDSHFVEWLSSAKPSAAVQLDTQAFGKCKFRIYLLDISDFFEMTDFVIAALSVNNVGAAVFLAGRDYLSVFTALSALNQRWDYFQLIEDLQKILNATCKENYIMCV